MAVLWTPPSPAGRLPHQQSKRSTTDLPFRFSRLRQSSDLLQDVNLTHPLFLLLASGPVVGEDQLSLGKHDHVAVSSQLCVLTLCGGPCRVAGREWLSYLLLKAHGEL